MTWQLPFLGYSCIALDFYSCIRGYFRQADTLSQRALAMHTWAHNKRYVVRKPTRNIRASLAILATCVSTPAGLGPDPWPRLTASNQATSTADFTPQSVPSVHFSPSPLHLPKSTPPVTCLGNCHQSLLLLFVGYLTVEVTFSKCITHYVPLPLFKIFQSFPVHAFRKEYKFL